MTNRRRFLWTLAVAPRSFAPPGCSAPLPNLLSFLCNINNQTRPVHFGSEISASNWLTAIRHNWRSELTTRRGRLKTQTPEPGLTDARRRYNILQSGHFFKIITPENRLRPTELGSTGHHKIGIWPKIVTHYKHKKQLV